MRALLKNFSVTYHQFIFFCVHLIILRFLGISYSGEIAYVAAITGVVAVIVSMRWDIEILVRSIKNAKESFQKGFVTILLLTGSILFLSFLGIIIFDLDDYNFLILSGCFVAMNELMCSSFFKRGKIYVYSLLRSLPAVFLLILAMWGFSPVLTWLLSFVFTAIVSLVILNFSYAEIFTGIMRIKFKKLGLKEKFFPTMSTLVSALFFVFWVILIKIKAGEEAAGIWANSIRIFNSPLTFLVVAISPFILSKVGESEEVSKKIKNYLSFWFFLSPVILITIFVVIFYGEDIFDIFLANNIEVNAFIFLQIFIVGVIQSFITLSQGVFQSISRTKFLTFVLLIGQLMGFYLLIFSKESLLSEFILQIVLISSLCCLTLIIGMIYFYLIDNKRKEGNKYD